MRKRQGLLLLILLVGATATVHANKRVNPELIQSLNECVDSRFSLGEASEINEQFTLDTECPDLFTFAQVDRSLQRLDPPLDNDTSLNQLLDAQFLLSQQNNPENALYTLADKSFLKELAAKNDFDSSPVELGLWDRFINWLKEHYKDKEEADTDWGWLIDFLDNAHIPDWLGKAVYYTSIGLIIILAALIVFNEVRAARRGGRRKRRGKKTGGSEWHEDLATIESLDWDEIGKLPVHQQPGAMLRFVIDELIERDWISDNRSRTNREMWRELRTRHQQSAGKFEHAVVLAEQSVYGEQQLSDEQLHEMYDAAQALSAKNEDPEK